MSSENELAYLEREARQDFERDYLNTDRAEDPFDEAGEEVEEDREEREGVDNVHFISESDAR